MDETARIDTAKQAGSWRDYLAIARLDHSTKHIFIVPGIVLAYMLRGLHVAHPALSLVAGLVVAVSIASANYVINEFLDREFDRHHPTKSARSAVQRELSGQVVALEWLGLVTVGLTVAALSSKTLFVVAVVFAAQGVFYNVRPLRTKDKPVLDVISESINNPLRLMIGWAIIDPFTLPPGSLIAAYWLGGAFLMAAKRLSEYREICASHGVDLLGRYRASFLGYTETSLTVSCFVYSLLASFFLAVFLIKYRIEYILLIPLIAVLFGEYLSIAMQAGSSAQKPEKLYREKKLIGLVLLLGLVFTLATFVRLPLLDTLTQQRYITLP